MKMIYTQNQNDEETKTNFSFSIAEIAIALISYVLGYIYVKFTSVSMLLVLVIVVGCTEFLNRKKPLTKENVFYTICFAIITIAYSYSIKERFNYIENEIWDESMLALFTHGMAIWYVISRSGKLVDGKSSVFFPMDIINGAISIPFSNLFLRLKTIISSIAQSVNNRKENKERNYWFIPAIIICVVLFVAAASLLSQSDDTFGKVINDFLDVFKIEWDLDLIVTIIFSLPVGAYLYGLIVGSYRYEEENLPRIKTVINDFLSSLKRIPAWFWLVVVSLFSVMYLCYFFLQGSYLFGAFTNTLPEGFIISQYAVKGFWQLCQIMAVNGAVLYVVTRMADQEAKNNPYFKFACIFLLIESILFAVIALSKIILYISVFGFTPKRIQGFWLVTVLMVGCILWIINLIKERKTFAYWMYFTIFTLTATCLYSLL